MQAIRIHRFGGPEVLRLDDLPSPIPAGAQALVRVRAASVNPVDFKIRKGGYPRVKDADLPIVLGRDLAGDVIAVGPEQTSLKVGDRVLAHLGWKRGGYAQEVLIEPGEWALLPAAVDYETAAALTLVGDTAWQGLFDQGGLKAGQRVLIHGATGGVGQMAVQFAHQAGAHVFATGGAESLDLLRALGADEAIDYKAQRFEDVARDLDLVFDTIGGDTRARSWPLLKEDGVLVTTVGSPGFEQEAAAAGRTGKGYSAVPKGDDLAEFVRRAAAGTLRVEISQTFPLAQAADAHRALEQGHPHGKIVLMV